METNVLDYSEVEQDLNQVAEKLVKLGYDEHVTPDAWMVAYTKEDNSVKFNALEEQVEIDGEYQNLESLLESEQEQIYEGVAKSIDSMAGSFPGEGQ